MKLPNSITYEVGAADNPLNPREFFSDRPGLLAHPTFHERVLPVLQPSHGTPACTVESVTLAPLLDVTGKRYPRNLKKYVVPRYEPNSRDIAAHFAAQPRAILVDWPILARLLWRQRKGESGLLSTYDQSATFLFMAGIAGEMFLIRVFWHRNVGSGCWLLRAWSLQERIQRGWDTSKNRLLLPVTV